MTQDEIIEIAKQAGMDYLQYISPEAFEKATVFVKLVAQQEREACAEICKKHADVYAMLEQNPTAKSAWAACIDTRDAIRARP
jgi:hypothetical protein